MDLVTCPKCRFTFSPTPGKAPRCPSCMTAIAVAKPGPTEKRKPPTKLPQPAAPPAPTPVASAPRRSWGFAILLVVAGLAGGIGLAATLLPRVEIPRDQPTGVDPAPAVAVVESQPPKIPTKPPTPLPTTPKPAIPPPKIDPTPAEGKDPSTDTVPETSPRPTKVRVVDPGERPPLTVDPVPVKRTVVRGVAGVTPQTIDQAIIRGASFLNTTAPQWSTTDSGYRLGYVSLAGLTLLECKTPPTNSLVRDAAQLTRSLALINTRTYEIVLAILFLDRLGDPRDRDLIKLLASRLIVGQNAGGGFGYNCEAVSPAETQQLLSFLHRTRPVLARPFSRSPFDPWDASVPKAGDPADPTDKSILGDPKSGVGPADPTQVVALTSRPPKILPKSRLDGNVGVVRLTKPSATANPMLLAPRLQSVPAVINQGREKDQMILSEELLKAGDQSNLQFAILGLWAARRHGVVSDRALMLAEMRMRSLQTGDGGWPYSHTTPGNTAMTCAGLLSLTLGQALHHPTPASLRHALANDEPIQRAFRHLGSAIGDPKPEGDENVPVLPSFLLWSVERVAVLFDRSNIEGKDWYGWGAQSLIKHQAANGSWSKSGFHGDDTHIDTCFSLLFLVRSNLVQDVTEQLRLQMPLSEPAK